MRRKRTREPFRPSDWACRPGDGSSAPADDGTPCASGVCSEGMCVPPTSTRTVTLRFRTLYRPDAGATSQTLSFDWMTQTTELRPPGLPDPARADAVFWYQQAFDSISSPVTGFVRRATRFARLDGMRVENAARGPDERSDVSRPLRRGIVPRGRRMAAPAGAALA